MHGGNINVRVSTLGGLSLRLSLFCSRDGGASVQGSRTIGYTVDIRIRPREGCCRSPVRPVPLYASRNSAGRRVVESQPLILSACVGVLVRSMDCCSEGGSKDTGPICPRTDRGLVCEDEAHGCDRECAKCQQHEKCKPHWGWVFRSLPLYNTAARNRFPAGSA